MEDAGKIGKDSFVTDSDDVPTVRFQQLGTSVVLFDLIEVNVAIDFDDQLARWTGEIHDERSKWMLPPK